MRATVYLDVLSHWCLAAAPAVQALFEHKVDVHLVLAPVNDGGAVGATPAFEAWCYERGTRAYNMRLHSDWYESEATTTWHANAAVVAGVQVGADLWRLACMVMSEAMQGGARFGRAEEVYAFVAKVADVDVEEIRILAQSDRIVAALHDGNRRLTEAGADERPTFHIANANGDYVLLKGIWQRDAVEAAVRALRADEDAYAAAGTPPNI